MNVENIRKLKVKRLKGGSSERCSDEYLELNSCGIENLSVRDRGTDRPCGRVDYHILYVERGVCNLFLDGEWQRVGAGGLIMFRPGEPQRYHYYKKDCSVSHYIHFTGVGCEAILKRLGIYNVRVFDMGRSSSYEELSEKMLREFVMQKPLCADWCSAYLYQLLNVVARKYALRQGSVNSKGESRINAACRRIYDNVKNPPSAEELANECCLSTSRFIHLFREVTDRSLTEFITGLRVEKAKELLETTDMPVREIAEAVGYENQNYFSRCFRKLEGCSPVEYRKNTFETIG